jgi:hypothetical protein
MRSVADVTLSEIAATYGLNVVRHLPLIIFALFLGTRLMIVVRQFEQLMVARYASAGHVAKKTAMRILVWVGFVFLTGNLVGLISSAFATMSGT